MARRTWVLMAILCGGAALVAAVAEDKPTLPGWGRLVNPDPACRAQVQEDKLTLAVPAGHHDLSAELKQMNAPRVLQEVEGDFVVQVKVSATFHPGQSVLPTRLAYQAAALVAMKDDRTYVRIDRANMVQRDGRSMAYANFELREDAAVVRFGEVSDSALVEGKDYYLRLERHDDRLCGAISPDGYRWQYLPPKRVGFTLPDKMLVGVTIINDTNQPATAQFSELKVFVEQPPVK